MKERIRREDPSKALTRPVKPVEILHPNTSQRGVGARHGSKAAAALPVRVAVLA